MLTEKYIGLLPHQSGTPQEQLRNCLSSLSRMTGSEKSTLRKFLKLSVFIKARDNGEFIEIKNRLTELLDDFFGPDQPPVSFIGQPPEGNRSVALEIAMLTGAPENTHFEYKTWQGARYSVVCCGDLKEVHAGGLTDDELEKTTADLSHSAFTQMKGILDQEGLTFSDVVRQWNTIENITSTQPHLHSLKQNYQQFNDVRSQFYRDTEFVNGYPAATGIGANTGGVVVEFTAVSPHEDITILPLSNPRQIDAHKYSGKVLVGPPQDDTAEKTPPKFERGKLVFHPAAGRIFVSGTAAILGQKTVSDLDVEFQTRTTIKNILALVSEENIKRCGFSNQIPGLSPSHLRVYVKNEQDIGRVEEICREYFGEVSALFVVSDICRRELLVEIEGIWDFERMATHGGEL